MQKHLKWKLFSTLFFFVCDRFSISATKMSKLLASLRASNYYLFELFLFLRLSSVFASAIAYSMLLQDKLCYISYNQTAAFCQNIQADISNTSNEMVKNDILAETTRFSNYK